MTSPLAKADPFPVATPDGAVLPVYALGGPSTAPGLLFAHANGLAAGSYAPWLAELTPRARVFAYDARGHGAAQWPQGPLACVFHVDRFAGDLAHVAAAVTLRLGGAPLHFAGHSLGAAAVLRLGSGDGWPWASVLLCEPPIFPPRQSPHHAAASAQQRTLMERSAARREQWPSPDAFCQALARRGPFRHVRPDLLAAHAAATLRLLPAGGYALCCPPAVEAAIFQNHRGADTWERLARLHQPVHLVSGDPTLPDHGWVSTIMPEMAGALPEARLTVLPGTSHMMLLEQPAVCRDLVLAQIEKLS